MISVDPGDPMNQDDIDAIREQVRPEVTEWFDESPTYSGAATGVFAERSGRIEGTAEVSFSPIGAEHIPWKVHTVHVDGESRSPATMADVHHVRETYYDVTATSKGVDMFGNELVQFSIDGELQFETVPGRQIFLGNDDDTLYPQPSLSFAHREGVAPRYWAVPLINMVSDFALSDPSFDDHPLRMTRPVNLDATVWPTDAHKNAATHERHLRNRVIPFEWNGLTGFIEPLPDYQRRVEDVEAGQRRVTCMMVGELPDGFEVSADNVGEVVPHAVFVLLRLATGRYVTSAWTEIRGADGELIARHHHRSSKSGLGPASPVIHEKYGRSTGELLSKYVESQRRDDSDFRVAIDRVAQGLARDQTLEQMLLHVMGGAELMCKALGRNAQEKMDLPVGDDLRDRTVTQLESCAESIREIAADADGDARDFLERLADRVTRQTNVQKGLGFQLVQLLRDKGFDDADVLDGLRFKMRSKATTDIPWPDGAFTYRNKVAHGDYLQIEKYSMDSAWAMIHHVADVVLRLAFHEIGFEGPYEPPCVFHVPAIKGLGWAGATSISAEKLGYEVLPST